MKRIGKIHAFLLVLIQILFLPIFSKVNKAWQNLLFIHASNVDLWRHFLLRQQARLSTFSFNRMVKKYHLCFQTLVPIIEGKVKIAGSSLSKEDMEKRLIGKIESKNSSTQNLLLSFVPFFTKT